MNNIELIPMHASPLPIDQVLQLFHKLHTNDPEVRRLMTSDEWELYRVVMTRLVHEVQACYVAVGME